MFSEKLLAIFAHPDDESFLAGGTLALAAKRTDVKVVIATPGQKGRSHIDYEISDKNLGDLRRRETGEAMKALGVEDYAILDYEDGALDRTDEKEIAERLAAIMKDFNPASVLTFGPDGITGHRDHIAIGRFATKAAKACGVQVYWLARPRSQQNPVRNRDWPKTEKSKKKNGFSTTKKFINERFFFLSGGPPLPRARCVPSLLSRSCPRCFC